MRNTVTRGVLKGLLRSQSQKRATFFPLAARRAGPPHHARSPDSPRAKGTLRWSVMRVSDRACARTCTGTSLGLDVGVLEHVRTGCLERMHCLLTAVRAGHQADLSRVDGP